MKFVERLVMKNFFSFMKHIHQKISTYLTKNTVGFSLKKWM